MAEELVKCARAKAEKPVKPAPALQHKQERGCSFCGKPSPAIWCTGGGCGLGAVDRPFC